MLQEYPLDAPYLKYKLLATEMATMMKTPTSRSEFHEFVANQVDTTRNFARFTYTLDEFLAAAQLADFETSASPVLTMTRHKVLTKIETKSVSLSTQLINETATKLFRRAAHSSSADSDGDLALVTKSTDTACPGCKQCPLHCMKDGLWRPKPGEFDNIKSPRLSRATSSAARALVANLDRDTIDNLAVLFLQGKSADLDLTLEQHRAQAATDLPSDMDEKQNLSDLMAIAAEWSDAGSDVSSDEVI